MGAAAVAAVMRRRENEVVEDFRAAGATSRETAQSYTAIGLGQSMGLRRLRERAVIREVAPGAGTFYLDEEVWTAVRRTRRRIATIFITIFVLILIGVLLGGFKAS